MNFIIKAGLAVFGIFSLINAGLTALEMNNENLLSLASALVIGKDVVIAGFAFVTISLMRLIEGQKRVIQSQESLRKLEKLSQSVKGQA
ncbi:MULTISPECIES: hypothetical protein [unclassified Pseudovibrio]|uniref:hypothetical protein n=1 Tax=unclassified Pseudovibrio TaxID=2627060 RepID=UPI0007092FF9|nr:MULTISPECIES: hypothetical protein [unclassified Pseudovibrio]KZL18658.1 hypothetical protein PsAD37_03835 [Pseudovibrio sp. Ad37]